MNLYLCDIQAAEKNLVGNLRDKHGTILGSMLLGDRALCDILHKHGPHVAFTVSVTDQNVPALPEKKDVESGKAAPEPKASPHPATEPPAPPLAEKKSKKGK